VAASLNELEKTKLYKLNTINIYDGWNFNSGNYLFTTDTK